MQNGGLSQFLNPYSFLSGGGITGTAVGSNASAGASLLKSNQPSQQQQQYMASGGPSAGLNRSQISNLWSNGPLPGSSFSRSPFGLGGQYGSGGGASQDEEEVAAEDEEDMGVIETYSNYWPAKLKIGKPHPDPVVETASLASVEPPKIWYELSLPDTTIEQAKLSALQLEAVTYSVRK